MAYDIYHIHERLCQILTDAIVSSLAQSAFMNLLEDGPGHHEVLYRFMEKYLTAFEAHEVVRTMMTCSKGPRRQCARLQVFSKAWWSC